MADIRNGVIYNGPTNLASLCKYFDVRRRADKRYHVQDLILSSNINVKSKAKPMEYNDDDVMVIQGVIFCKKTQLHDDQRKKKNYGHTFYAYDNALSAIRAVASETNFPYNRPSTWKRPADFWGYVSDADNWYTLGTSVASLGEGGSTNVTISNLTDVFTLGKLKDDGVTMYNATLGLLMWNGAFSADQPQIYFYSLNNVGELVDTIDNLTISATGDLGQGSWRMYPVITTANYTKGSFTYIREENPNGMWYPLPFCNTKVLDIVASGQGDENLTHYLSIVSAESDIELVDASSLTYTMSNLSVGFTNSGDVDYDVSVEWQIRGALSAINKPASVTVDATIPANISEAKPHLVELYSAKENAYRFSVAETPVTLEVTYYMNVNGDIQSGSQTIQLTN